MTMRDRGTALKDAAAANPALRSIRYHWAGQGLTVGPRPAGCVDVVDSGDGGIVPASGAGQMWDSSACKSRPRTCDRAAARPLFATVERFPEADEVVVGHMSDAARLAAGQLGTRAFIDANPRPVRRVTCDDTGRPDDLDVPADLRAVSEPDPAEKGLGAQ
jgi:hypothetical protein